MSDPINRLVLQQLEFDNTTYTWTASVDAAGNLRLEGHDRGERVEAAWGHDAYDYSRVIAERYRDTVLLWLLKERFKSDSAVGDWLAEKGIPSDSQSNLHGD